MSAQDESARRPGSDASGPRSENAPIRDRWDEFVKGTDPHPAKSDRSARGLDASAVGTLSSTTTTETTARLDETGASDSGGDEASATGLPDGQETRATVRAGQRSATATSARTDTATSTVTETYFERVPRRGGVPLLVGAAALAGLSAFHLTKTRHDIEEDLRARSLAALRNAGLDQADVTFNGRDGTVTGDLDDSQLRTAHSVVRGLEGVRHVTERSAKPLSKNTSAATSTLAKVTAPSAETTVPVNEPVVPTPTPDSSNRTPEGTAPDTSLAAVETAANVDTIPSTETTQPVDATAAAQPFGTGVAEVEFAEVVAFDQAVPADDAGASSSDAQVSDAQVSAPTVPLQSSPVADTNPPEVNTPVVNGAAVRSMVVEFAAGGAAVTPNQELVLDQLAQMMGARRDVVLEIGGHTDALGNDAGNRALSLARATAVKDALVARGVAEDRLRVVAFGSDLPVASNSVAAGRRRNRRVTFEITDDVALGAGNTDVSTRTVEFTG